MPHTKHTHKKTKDSITTTVASDGGKNTTYLVSGCIEHEDDSIFDIIDVSALAGKPTNVRIDSLLFAIESGLKVVLKYRNLPYMLPLEGRGVLNLETVGGLAGHEIDMVCKGKGSFFLVVDISKLGV